MQSYDKDNKPMGDPALFDAKKMEELLKKPEVDHVRVFRLKLGDELKIHGEVYDVKKVLGSNRFVIKKRG